MESSEDFTLDLFSSKPSGTPRHSLNGNRTENAIEDSMQTIAISNHLFGGICLVLLFFSD